MAEEELSLEPTSNMLEVEEGWVNNGWDMIMKARWIEVLEQYASIQKIDLDQKTIGFELRTTYGNHGSKELEASKAKTFKTILSYFGEYEVVLDIEKFP